MAVPYLPLIGEVCDGFIVEREGESAADAGMQQKGGISFQKPDEKASRSTNGPNFDAQFLNRIRPLWCRNFKQAALVHPTQACEEMCWTSTVTCDRSANLASRFR